MPGTSPGMTLQVAMRRDSGVARQTCPQWSAPSRGPAKLGDRRLQADGLALASAAVLQLHLTLGDALRPDDRLPGQTYKIHRRELRARPLVSVIVERLAARLAERGDD